MSTPLTATIIVPTSIDRGPTLRLAVDSALRQTVRDLEVFIITDGAAPETVAVAKELAQSDPRVRLFEHPKHPRRGEPYRDEALKEASGRIICYLCDRDLFLPDHVEQLAKLLENAEFACTPGVAIRRNGKARGMCAIDPGSHRDRRDLTQRRLIAISLSFFAHTLAAYHQLPERWTETPRGHVTDGWFIQKFLRQPAMRCVTGTRPTVLYFPRGSHPGWSTAQRCEELLTWHDRMAIPGEAEAIREELYAGIYRTNIEITRKFRRTLFRVQPKQLLYRLHDLWLKLRR
jgi:glycosyltransferase involved in cell wall biosynthesis